MIGVFDSGIGGLTLLSSIRQACPNIPLVYVADSAYAPYGELPASTIRSRCEQITQWLIEQGCQLVVVACNTATAVAVDSLRAQFNVPIIGVEPGVKPAALNTQSGSVGILATENTLVSQRYQRLIERFLPNVNVLSQGCTGLALAIETCQDVIPLLTRFVPNLIEQGVDHIVLGCTHYPLIKPQLQSIIGSDVQIIDTADAIAQETCRRWHAEVPAFEPINSVVLYATQAGYQMKRLAEHYPSLAWLAQVPLEVVAIGQKS